MSLSKPQRKSVKPVQGTNDSSIISKLSMCEAGYFLDPYLKHFVARHLRRTPLINRGYYIRAMAVTHTLKMFLEHYSDVDTQVISLGAGFDSCYFRLCGEGRMAHCKFFEVDFPSTMQHKLSIILTTPELSCMVPNVSSRGDKVTVSDHYCIIGCDLYQLDEFQTLLKLADVDYTIPTLLLSECVLTYMDVSRVNALLSWSAKSFSNAVFCTYEQIQPEDGFGLVMQQHFLSIGSPLKNLASYPTQQSQESRYLQMGWYKSSSFDMNSFYNILPLKEKQRVNTLEMFDEYEEWHCKCNHYMLLYAFQGTCSALSSVLPIPNLLIQSGKCIQGKELEILPLEMKCGSAPITRYAHGSTQLCTGEILISSGFGSGSTRCPHMRLDDVQLLKPGGMGKWICKALPTHGTGPGKLMHHSITFLPSRSSALLYGGRKSPAQANGSCYLLQCDVDSVHCQLEPLQIDNTSETPEPRWRHTATCITYAGYDCVAIIGGCSSRVSALDDCFLLKTKEWKFEKLDVCLPEGRHSHYAVAYKKSIIIIGGLNTDAEPVGSCLELSCTDNIWQLKEMTFEVPLPSRYSMAGVLTEDVLWLLGGIQLHTTPGLLMVNLVHRTWMEYGLKYPGPQPLLHGHTCHRFEDKLIITGGGGNCFSFGTSLNLTPFVFEIPLLV